MSVRRMLFVMAIVGLVFAVAVPSSVAQKNKKKKKKGAVTAPVKVEGTTWYWESQESVAPSDTTGGCPEGVPVCPDQRVALPNPHEVGALPVQVLEGEDEKVSAILFDYSFLGELPNGAKISKFTFSVTESPDARDRTQFVNAANKSVLACLITDFWPPSEDGAEDMENAPPFDCTKSATGTRVPGQDGAPATWTFDITEIAAPWGEDASSRFGVMLAGVRSGNESWQIVLKGTRRDAQETPADEQELNKGNIQASITYTANPEPKPPTTSNGTDDATTTPVTTTPPTTTTTPVTTTPVSGSGDFGIGSSTAAPPAPVAEEIPETTTIQPVATEQAGPEMPAYVWALFPVGLLALAMVRSVVMDPIPGKRPDGVVAQIRERNAQRRGTPLAPAARSRLAGVGRFVRSAGGGMRRGSRGLIRGMGKLTKRS